MADVRVGDIWVGPDLYRGKVILRPIEINGAVATCKVGQKRGKMTVRPIPLERFETLELVHRR